ncbi:hypothetical protein [Cohnella laeviribosi]|uniref:hypothetical protein n=1 Tax=Cohnella laeviribosi TaxID=380174 RepID=UPI003D1B0B5C
MYANEFDMNARFGVGSTWLGSAAGRFLAEGKLWSEDIVSSWLYFFLRILGYINENREKFDILNQ